MTKETLEKAKKTPKLVPETRIVTRGGKTFPMTVWVDPTAKDGPAQGGFDFDAPEPEKKIELVVPVESRNDELIQTLIDAVDTIGNDPERQDQKNRYIAKIMSLGGVYQSKETGMGADPRKYLTPDDFQSFKEYSTYCQRRYEMNWKTKNLEQYKDHDGAEKISSESELDDLGKAVRVKFKIVPKKIGTESAWVSGDNEVNLVESELDHAKIKGVIVHELAHILDNRILRGNPVPANDMANSVSSYGTMNAGEAFAESFREYFTNPERLKAVNLDGYHWLDMKIPGEWKIAIGSYLNGGKKDTKRRLESDMKANQSDASLDRQRKERVYFSKPYTGKTGAKLLGYEWPHVKVDGVDKRGEDRTYRYSDWSQAEVNDMTGRKIVHKFLVKVDDEVKPLSAESAAEALGISITAARTQAKKLLEQEIRHQKAEAKFNAEVDEIDSKEWYSTPAEAVDKNTTFRDSWAQHRHWGKKDAEHLAEYGYLDRSRGREEIPIIHGPKGYQWGFIPMAPGDNDRIKALGWTGMKMRADEIWDKEGRSRL